MPKDVFGRDPDFGEREEILGFEENARLARIFASLGVEKIRITAGEPLLRHDLERLTAMLARIPGLDLTLTTNGSLRAEKTQALKDAGLRRVTVSLNSLEN
ncbi:MAG TPA: radical SAM protein [Opitutaceae bacterium]